MKSDSSTCGSGNLRPVENVLEHYFKFHASFSWDQAKDFIERERDLFRAEHPSHVSSIMASMLNAMAQLAIVDKNYYTLQFFTSKVFQRKDLVKGNFESLKMEFSKLENRGLILSQSIRPTINSSLSSSSFVTTADDLTSEQAIEAIYTEDEYSTDYEESVDSGSKSYEQESSKSSRSGFFTKASQLFGFSKPSSGQSSLIPKSSETTNLAQHYCLKGSEPDSISPKTDHYCSIEAMDQFAAHLCGQLVSYCKVRIDMIEQYERLSTPSGKFCLVDDSLQPMRRIQTFVQNNFNHTVLAYLKFLLAAECDILFNLLRVQTLIQDWKYLDSLFSLQEAHDKLNLIANMRDTLQMTTSGGQSPSAKVSNSFTGMNFLRRNFTSTASLTSSGSSNLSVPTVPIVASGNFSPLSTTNFIFPTSKEQLGSNLITTGSGKIASKSFNPATLPLLIQWLHRYKLFLLSKYSFYFHSLLMDHLSPSAASFNVTSSTNLSTSNSSAESLMKQLCSKHLYDFHQRVVHMIRKYDSSYVILIFDGPSKGNICYSGYRSPYIKQEPPIGINAYPIIYSYPGDLPKSRIPSIVMIMNDRMDDLNANDMVVVEHDKPFIQNGAMIADLTNSGNHNTSKPTNLLPPINSSANNFRNASYFLVRPDPNFTLALICESKRLERDTLIVPFMQEMCALLKGTKIFSSLKTGNWK